jgi:SecD/SecF fusion protein
MSRPSVVRAVLAFAVLAGSLYFAIAVPARLGLDLRGGTQIVLETQDSPTAEADAEATDRSLEVLRRRVDALGVSEPTLARSGERRIIIELPGIQDPREAAEVIGRTAQLTFHPVIGIAAPEATPSPTPAPSPIPGDREIVLSDERGERLRLGPVALTGEGVGEAEAAIDPESGLRWFVTVDFRGSGERAWAQLTGKAACAPQGDPRRRVAIVLDNEILSAPQVDPSVACETGIAGGSTQITGEFTEAEARELGVLIRAGALPVPVETVEQRVVGPTLGAAAIEASAKAAVIGIILTALFIVVVYRLLGALAVVALGAYALISYAAMVALGATLTLPGLAGFVLAIGMAVDANVLVFERAREEYASGRAKGLRSALAAGFAKAWSAIADSNVTTLLAAGLLFFLATGPVRGFGVTLSLGVLASMFSALVITRMLAEWAVQRRPVRGRPGITGMSHLGRVRQALTRRNADLMQHRRRWLAVSLLAVLLAITGVGVRGLDFGVEFTGGRLIEYATSRPVDVDTARAAVTDSGFPRAVVQASGEQQITVRTERMSNDEQERVRGALAEVSGGEVTKQRDELIGPSLGDELRRKALLALAIALAVQLLYLAIRFRWTFGAAAVTAMAHDVLVLVGIFAWLGKPIDGVFLAALLTVIGYSVNDSVVVFDRVREIWQSARKKPFPAVVNTAILQTVPRTVNTGLGAVFILAALAFLGGDSLTDFAIALLIGIAVGTSSSMFTAAPLAIELERYNAAPPPASRQPASAGARTGSRRDSSGAVV